MRPTRLASAALALTLALAPAAGCTKTTETPGPDPSVTDPSAADRVLRPRAAPIEFVGFTLKRKVDAAAFRAFVGPLFGEAARQGRGHKDLELQPGLFLTVEADPRTAEQLIARVDMVPPGATERRTVVRVPMSFAYGALYIDTAEAALANAAAKLASEGSMEPFNLDLQARSPLGGRMLVKLDFAGTQATLVVEAEGPQTSLTAGTVNQPAFSGRAYETIGGTVWFKLARSEFDFFSTRAYGITPGFRQNFSDFKLLPHEWLRLTVKPLLSQGLVDVNFEVVTLDERRIPIARAPASVLAGEQFQKNVLRLVDNMAQQEATRPGSSDDWQAPFYYDDPAGGGVVQVIAQGSSGVFRIAYSVAAPTHYLEDVDFVRYAGKVDIPTDIPDQKTECEALGSVRAPVGRFVLRFRASTTVVDDPNRDGPLAGRVVGSIYKASDVTIVGPKDGATPVASFDLPDVDLGTEDFTSTKTYPIAMDLPAGSYQILGFLDADKNASATDPEPDTFDPVFIPIGAYDLECQTQPTDVEFALLLPEDR